MSIAPREGARVSFVGDEFNGERLTVGDEGKVLSNGGSACHVMWQTGERRGQITLAANSELLQAGTAPGSGDGLVSMAVRDIYEEGGNRGLLRTMADEGYLAAIAPAAEEALSQVTAHLREDPAVQEVLASLDDDEADSFVSYAALTLLRDAFGGD